MNAADAWKDGWANALVFIHDAHEWKSQRDEAREAARFYRDLYVSKVGRTYPEEYTLPWEENNGADRNGC